jgi:hypothetical protein
LSQNSGELPNSRDKRKAITGVMARRCRNNSFTVCRDTPKAAASVAVVKPKSGMKSSLSISPGCIGGISRLLVFFMAI